MVGQKHSPGYPSRQNMVRAAIFMERRGFTFSEYSVVARLCNSDIAIRKYILIFAAECLDAFEGLVPHRGIFSYETALIAAFNVYKRARKEIGQTSEEYIDSLLQPPAPWTPEQKEETRQLYLKSHPDCDKVTKVTSTLLEALEQDAAVVYQEPYTTKSGCTILPFGPKTKEARAK